MDSSARLFVISKAIGDFLTQLNEDAFAQIAPALDNAAHAAAQVVLIAHQTGTPMHVIEITHGAFAFVFERVDRGSALLRLVHAEIAGPPPSDDPEPSGGLVWVEQAGPDLTSISQPVRSSARRRRKAPKLQIGNRRMLAPVSSKVPQKIVSLYTELSSFLDNSETEGGLLKAQSAYSHPYLSKTEQTHMPQTKVKRKAVGASDNTVVTTTEGRRHFPDFVQDTFGSKSIVGFDRYGRFLGALVPPEAIALLAGDDSEDSVDDYVKDRIRKNAQLLMAQLNAPEGNNVGDRTLEQISNERELNDTKTEIG